MPAAVTVGECQVRLSASKYNEMMKKSIGICGSSLVAKDLSSMGCPVVLNNGRIEAEDGWVIEVERYTAHDHVDIRWWRRGSAKPKAEHSAT